VPALEKDVSHCQGEGPHRKSYGLMRVGH